MLSEQISYISKMLPALKLVDPLVTIGGKGARNWYFSKKANQVDIILRFTEAKGNSISSYAATLGTVLGVKLVEARPYKFSLATYTFEAVDTQINIVFVPEKTVPSSVVSSFEVDIDRIEFDIETMMPLPTRAFVSSVKDKKIYLPTKVKEGSDTHSEYVDTFPDFEVQIKETQRVENKRGDYCNFTIQNPDQIVEFG